MSTYTKTKVTLDTIAKDSDSLQRRTDNLVQAAKKIQSDLSDMAKAYLSFATQLNADALANPTDAAWIASKAEKDSLFTEFQANKAQIDLIVIALNK